MGWVWECRRIYIPNLYHLQYLIRYSTLPPGEGNTVGGGDSPNIIISTPHLPNNHVILSKRSLVHRGRLGINKHTRTRCRYKLG